MTMEGERRAPERDKQVAPKIYVASLSDYNSGRLHGVWLDADRDVDDLQAAVDAMLKRSPEPHAEEFAILDYEEFGPVHLDEYTPLDVISQVAKGLVEHGPAFGHWADYV